MLSLLRLKRKQKKLNPSRIRIIIFLSFSSGIETTKTFIHSRSSFENHTRFRTKMGKVCTRFQTKKAQKPYPLGRHIPTILDKTVEKIVYLDSIFLNIVAVPVLPSPPSPESNVVVYSKESLIPGRLWEATLNWGKGFSFRRGVVLKIALLRRKVDMMGKTFSSSFVRDCI